ncbi:MAG TPA: M18 family aminopeptidase [Microthrixaceae bacterium]|nr:M18 family aminopeptidase [Microthrixaceae bacterium]
MHTASDLAGFIDASPTQFHAVYNAAARLIDAGFEVFNPAAGSEPGARLVVKDGALIAWVDGPSPLSPLRMIGAHTDSPNLRIRPRPDVNSAGFRQLGVEVYGGALLNSWLDRDLGIAGRAAISDGDGGVTYRLFRSNEPQVRVPQLAIHLDRAINERGLLLDRQQHMTPIWSLGTGSEGDFGDWLADLISVGRRDVLGWDAACFDFQPSAILGKNMEFLAAPRLDNLCSTFGAVEALIATKWAGSGPAMIALFDHEEVGSNTATGADSVWLSRVLEQRRQSLGLEPGAWLQSLDSALLLSADMAHGTHPNYADRHEPNHHIVLGGGPVIKHNVNARYATDSIGAAEFRLACERVDVSAQDYSHRGDLPCGSTIGPLAASQLSVRTVDVGIAQLSMHSAREMMAVADVDPMVRAFTAWLTPPRDQ